MKLLLKSAVLLLLFNVNISASENVVEISKEESVKAITFSDIEGSWDFKSPSAPYEYSKGKIIFTKNKEKSITAKVVMSNGSSLTANGVKISGAKVLFHINVEGEDCNITMQKSDAKLKGVVITNSGDYMDVTLTKSPKAVKR